MDCGKTLHSCSEVHVEFADSFASSFHRGKKKKKSLSDVLCEESPISERGLKVIENPQQQQ